MFKLFVRFSLTITGILVIFVSYLTPMIYGRDSVPTNTVKDVNPVLQIIEMFWSEISLQLSKYFQFSKIKGSTASCYSEIKTMVKAAYDGDEWALSMLDAFGKPGAGILDGNTVWAGSYKECLKINNKVVSGKYCWLEMPIGKHTIDWNQTFTKFNRNSLRLAVCVPSACDSNDVDHLVNIIKSGIQKIINRSQELAPVSVKCLHNRNEELKTDLVALVAIGMCCILILLMAIGTYIDIKIQNKKNLSLLCEISICFSAYSNGKKLFNFEHGKNLFPELNGLKALAATLVIFGHTYLYTWRLADNPIEQGEVLSFWYFQFPAHFYYSVDIFFAITGFLTLNTFLQKFVKTFNNLKSSQIIFYYVAHRYWRMILAPGIILFVSRIALLPYLTVGPFWENLDPNCRSGWWKNFLFISNWWPIHEQCYPPWWYMSVSMQFHLLALVILFPLINKRYLLALYSGIVILLVSYVWVGWTSFNMDLPPSYSTLNRKEMAIYLENMKLYKDILYMNPFYHIGAYFSGMLCSWIIYKNKIKLSKTQSHFGGICCCILVFATVYLVYFKLNNTLKSLNSMVSSSIWGICVCWILLVCKAKNGGIISSILCWKFWLPLSKLALTFYLIQSTVIDYMCNSELVPLHFSEYSFFGLFIRHWLVSFVIAVPVSLLVEAPVFALEYFIEKRLSISRID